MKHFMTLMALVVAVTAGAQTEFCGPGTIWDPVSSLCLPSYSEQLLDANQDGVIGVADLLNLLSFFGEVDSDNDGIFDSVDECLDFSACNYQSNPSEECFYLDAAGVCGGTCQLDADGDGVCDWTCGADSIHFEGHVYPTTQIGSQCWFAESVRYLPQVFPANESNAYIPMAIVADYYGNSAEEAQNSENYIDHGCVYNWRAVDEWSLCPSGWEVPGFQSGIFEELIEEVGGNALAGLMLKSESWNGLDAYGFTFLPYPGQGLQGIWRSEQDNCGTGQSSGLLKFNSQDFANVACHGDQYYIQVRCIQSN
ncbi:fibrobacter succinogenes major paralogous domain-containing protein [Flavobacteriales bacterium]|nr:fibrobacter succinogenes major paralogous domain-containing protein [Flavobacteriales bacterium]